jgi:hypothetical protein
MCQPDLAHAPMLTLIVAAPWCANSNTSYNIIAGQMVWALRSSSFFPKALTRLRQSDSAYVGCQIRSAVNSHSLQASFGLSWRSTMPQRPRVESTPAEILSNASFNNKYLKMEVDNTRDIIILVVFVVAETESSGCCRGRWPYPLPARARHANDETARASD